MTKMFTAQFYAQYRGFKNPVVDWRPDCTADDVARRLVDLAVIQFNNSWPGLEKTELHVTGVSDFRMVLNGDGSTLPFDGSKPMVER